MIHLGFPDYLIIFAYFGIILFVGFRSARKKQTSDEDFLLAGRSLTLPVFVMTLVSTWYGGILGVGEFSYRYGISNWVTQGVPYYIFAAIFAFVLAKKIRETNLVSIPDKLEQSYDKKTALLGSVLTFILMTPAPYILMLSIFLQMLFGWSMLVSVLITAVVSVSYLFFGGFRSDVDTDKVEFVFMFLGFAIIIPFCVSSFGGLEFLQSKLPPLHLTMHGGNSWQYILVWFFIALWTLVDPAFHQRCYAAKDGATAQKGILVSILFWLVFDFLTATAGLYARAALPNLEEPMKAYPMLAEAVLPPIAKGLFYVGMLATIMSTLNTLALVSAQTLGRDIIEGLSVNGFLFRGLSFGFRVLGFKIQDSGYSIQDSSDEQNENSENPKSEIRNPKSSSITLIRFGLIISFLASVILALLVPSVVKIWYTLGTVVIPGLLVPLVSGYFERLKISARFAFLSMLFGWLTSLCWLMLGKDGVYPFGVEPMYPGLSVSLLMWVMGKLERTK
ncbi:MAG: sodium:solute symporter family protein [Ignavibacteriae bacterium]|nr:sodium:solute symporter family protein [Ignavibacteriota bacterium]